MMTAEKVNILDSLDVPARLAEFRDMDDGWLEGAGIAPDPAGLDWLSAAFVRHFPDTLPLPRTYPTAEGEIRMEWARDNNICILEINLADRCGNWLWFDQNSNAEQERLLNLSDPAAWQWLAAEIAARFAWPQ